MPGMFFTSWDLWQQMTFVLAMSIMAVFCAGLGKLWWNNRLMKKQEVLDVEKRARVEELRKTGLPMKRANLVPFGVRAIQSGIEVDGIWISRPASLNELGEKLASSTTLAGRDSDSQKKGRYHSSGDERSVVVTTTNLDRGGPKQSPSTASIFQKLTDTDSTDDSAHSAAPPASQFASHKLAKRHPSRQPAATATAPPPPPPGSSTLNEDTLRRLQGHAPPKPHHHYETYIPTTSSPSPSPSPRRNPRQRSPAASSSADSVGSSGRSYHTSSSQSSRLYTAARSTPPPGQCPQPQASSPSGVSAFSLQGGERRRMMMMHGGGREEMAAPEPTFGPGDLHFNRASRRVNGGFEVLPAGTFGMGIPAERETETEREGEGSGGRGSVNTGSQGNRLRKSGG